jgi:hypothetical protein
MRTRLSCVFHMYCVASIWWFLVVWMFCILEITNARPHPPCTQVVKYMLNTFGTSNSLIFVTLFSAAAVFVDAQQFFI